MYVCVSGGKKCSFFGKFGMLCFLETPVLRFSLSPYYWRLMLGKNWWLHGYFTKIIFCLLRSRSCWRTDLQFTTVPRFMLMNSSVACLTEESTFTLVKFAPNSEGAFEKKWDPTTFLNKCISHKSNLLRYPALIGWLIAALMVVAFYEVHKSFFVLLFRCTS